jgi:hypothetical protein
MAQVVEGSSDDGLARPMTTCSSPKHIVKLNWIRSVRWSSPCVCVVCIWAPVERVSWKALLLFCSHFRDCDLMASY